MILTKEKLEKLDEAYEQYNRKSVDYLVKELRKVRRIIESGTNVTVESTGKILDSFTEFYFWAHHRYPALEDDPKVEWIGMD